MEEMVMNMSSVRPDFWKDKRVLVTGHTGFKGSWLSLWLQSLGAELHGLALPPPTEPALFEEARVADEMHSMIGDIRDFPTVLSAMAQCKPDIVIHMAAQPLVRHSYEAPVETYATNVMGTLHVLEASRQIDSVKAIVNVTTDKCYENKEWVWGYREDDPMGGYDPYSSSKGCSELVTSAYRRSFFNPNGVALASARSGNVIGGGDWATDRLVPDVLRAFEQSRPVVVRNPRATRPWQHVLEPLSGYLLLAERLFNEGQSFAEGWNFGPEDKDVLSVQWIVENMVENWGTKVNWELDGAPHPHEAHCLKLDISKAKDRLGWYPCWDLATALKKITLWHENWLNQQDSRTNCLDQIAQYQESMHERTLK
jgi:CDP-glucose 4,6-dehydratase